MFDALGLGLFIVAAMYGINTVVCAIIAIIMTLRGDLTQRMIRRRIAKDMKQGLPRMRLVK